MIPDELSAREETIRRMQDIIDKSVGGIISLARSPSFNQEQTGSQLSASSPALEPKDRANQDTSRWEEARHPHANVIQLY